MSRPLVRSAFVLAVALVVGAAWFGLFAVPTEPARPIAAAAPSDGPSPSPAPGSSLSNSPTPESPTLSPSSSVPADPGPSSSVPAGPTPTPFSTGPIVVAPSVPATGVPATRTALSKRLDSLRGTYGLPGVSAAILFADGSMWRGSSGFADVEARRPVNRDTQFAVASISKTFLAALILTFVDEGRIELDAPVVTYLPDPAFDRAITVRRLLDHTSGLHDYFYDPDIDEALLAVRERVWATEDVLPYIGKPYFKPGKGWRYSNTNYLILGMLAEEIADEPLADQIRARFLDPLELEHSHYQGFETPIGPLAIAYRFNGPGLDLPPIPLSDGTDVMPFTSVVTAAGSAGSIASTANDLVIWARALYGGDVLTVRSRVAMVADVLVTAPFEPSIPYGLGVQAATVDARPTLGHSGRLLGSRTVVRWLPEEEIAIAVLTNQSRADPNVLVRDLLRVVLGTPTAGRLAPP